MVVSLLTLTSSRLVNNPGAFKNVLLGLSVDCDTKQLAKTLLDNLAPLGQNDVRQLSVMNGDLNLKMRRYVLPPVLTKHGIIIQIF